MAIRPGKRKTNLKEGYTFSSSFEERKTLEYLRNLISSKFLHSKPLVLFQFSVTALGQNAVVVLLEKAYPEICGNENFAEWVAYDRLDENIPANILAAFLKEQILPLISRRLEKATLHSDSEIENRLEMLRNTFALQKEEVEVIAFYYLEEYSVILDQYFDHNDRFQMTLLPMFRSCGDILLGIKKAGLLKAITDGNLFKTGMMEMRGSNIGIESWCVNYLSGLGETDICYEFFRKGNDETLSISDFEVAEDELTVLDTLLRSSGRQNILLYGAPGTGKSSFARSLAKGYGKDLLTVKTPDTDDHKVRLRAILATVNVAARDSSIILVDEADEILNSYDSFFFKSKTNKSWINQFLESHEKKVIWITNRSSEIDPSTMRRFSFSMEFRKLDAKNRLKVIKYELSKKGIEDYFSEKELNEICKTYSVDAGGIINAINTLKIEGSSKKDTALRQIRTVLKSHEKATGGNKGDNKKEREFASYTLDGLNTSVNLNGIVAAIKSFESKPDLKNMSMAMLLYGMPGTGKSEFVYYLGNTMGKEVLLKRSSEIQSMWVGETEKNLSRAFAEAQEKSGILFFDEADTFLFPRKEASHSWEKSFTNEILTQLESYKGTVVFATNDMEGLDHAALRRFKFKIEFRPLSPEGNLHFYNTLLKGFVSGCDPLMPAEIKNLKSITNLTPGDFAVVKDQAVFMGPSALTHRILIDALANEVSYKKGVGKKIGF